MTGEGDAAGALAEAREWIAHGNFAHALARLRTAVETLPAGRADALVAGIREAADDLAKSDPRYAAPARAIRDSIAGRVGVPGLRGDRRSEEWWPYGIAEILSDTAVIAAVLSFTIGIVGVVEGARRHWGGNVLFILVGTVLTVALWLSIAVGLALLLDIGRTVGASRTE
ncbi:MAG TPA: hypothetical protein VGH79_10585 [Gaiellaceae bacterium]|jgi:hypothetical protein